MEQHNDEIEIDLMEILFVIRSRIVLIILTGAIFGVAAGLFTHYFITPKYSSTSGIYVLTNESTLSFTDLQISNSLTSDYIQLIQSRTVVEAVISNLRMDDVLTYESFLSCIKVENPADTRILNITVTYDDPRIAKELVDELALVSITRISDIMATNPPNIFEKGYVNTVPVSPNLRRNIVIAGLIGVLLCAAVIIVLHIMDDTIHSSEDIEKYLKLNTLAAIPVSEGSEGDIMRDDIKRRRGKIGMLNKLLGGKKKH